MSQIEKPIEQFKPNTPSLPILELFFCSTDWWTSGSSVQQIDATDPCLNNNCSNKGLYI